MRNDSSELNRRFGLPKFVVNRTAADTKALKSIADTAQDSVNWAEQLLRIPKVWQETRGRNVRVAVLGAIKEAARDSSL